MSVRLDQWEKEPRSPPFWASQQPRGFQLELPSQLRILNPNYLTNFSIPFQPDIPKPNPLFLGHSQAEPIRTSTIKTMNMKLNMKNRTPPAAVHRLPRRVCRSQGTQRCNAADKTEAQAGIGYQASPTSAPNARFTVQWVTRTTHISPALAATFEEVVRRTTLPEKKNPDIRHERVVVRSEIEQWKR